MNEAMVPMTGEIVPMPVQDLSLARAPEQVLQEAQTAAAALKRVISGKARPVMFNGEQYLEFEDWQTCGRFYGLSAKVVSTAPVDFDGVRGFEAHAEVISISTGQVVSAADAMCLNDEPNWKNKPLFQLRSMAQTRACAKALRNVLAWVVVLAGYRPTPAEEMTEHTRGNGNAIQPPQRRSSPAPAENGNGLFVAGVGSRDGETNGKKWTVYVVEFSDGRKASTFDEAMARLAEDFADQHTAVDARMEPGKKAGTLNLVELAKAVDDLPL